MAERITLGGEYENEDGETRTKYWIDVSSSLMNRITAVSMEDGVSPQQALAEVVSGDRELEDPDADADADAEAA